MHPDVRPTDGGDSVKVVQFAVNRLSRLPHLTTVFPVAVGLASRMPSIPLQNYQVTLELDSGDLFPLTRMPGAENLAG